MPPWAPPRPYGDRMPSVSRARALPLSVALSVALLVALLTALALTTTTVPARAAVGPTGPVSTSPPVVKGEAVYDGKLVAGRGTWSTSGLTYSYQWLREGRPIAGATARSYRPGLGDLDRRLAVRVTATDGSGGRGVAESAATDRVQRAHLRSTERPAVRGVARYTHIVTAGPGRWSTTPTRVRYQWLRAGKPVPGATHARYTYAPGDVGKRIRVKVTVKAPGYVAAARQSRRTGPVQHRVDVRRTATYSIATRGRISTSLRTFARQAAETYADPRGWRGGGVAFRRVPRGGSFTLVLAEASTVPSFSSACSSTYSCRVGRFVIINQTRWLHATPSWNAARGSLRDYRHMVVNHETGHWLGHGHASCAGRGRLAPVMMQQSKGLDGCRFNPWPTRAEQGGGRHARSLARASDAAVGTAVEE